MLIHFEQREIQTHDGSTRLYTLAIVQCGQCKATEKMEFVDPPAGRRAPSAPPYVRKGWAGLCCTGHQQTKTGIEIEFQKEVHHWCPKCWPIVADLLKEKGAIRDE